MTINSNETPYLGSQRTSEGTGYHFPCLLTRGVFFIFTTGKTLIGAKAPIQVFKNTPQESVLE